MNRRLGIEMRLVSTIGDRPYSWGKWKSNYWTEIAALTAIKHLRNHYTGTWTTYIGDSITNVRRMEFRIVHVHQDLLRN